MKEPKTSLWIVLLAFGVALVVTVLDFLPGLKNVPWYGLFVIPVVWIALWSAEDDVFPVTAMAVVVSLLAMVRGYLQVGDGPPVILHDRIVVICAIWFTVMLALLRKRARRTYKWINLAGTR